jgi:thiamine biosynthesis lipoprotein ApbE
MMRTTWPASDAPAAADWKAIGTLVRLVVTDPARLDEGRRLLAHDLAVLDLASSRFRADSELALAEQAAPAPVHVSGVLADAIGVALHAAHLTDGDLDPAMATSLAALGYDRDFGSVSQAGPPVKVIIRRHADWRHITLDQATGVLTLPKGMRLDLGATAKARAADLAAVRLADRLGCGVLVSLGGDIGLGGEPPEGGWRVRVQDTAGHPDDPPTGPAVTVTMTAGGLATSSITARRWRRGSVTLHHILDPRSGLPAAPVWRTVSVMAGTALHANIASTAAIIRGRLAPGWLEHLGLPARLVSVAGAVHTVGGWPAERQADRQTERSAAGSP